METRGGTAYLQRRCDNWINLCALIARCVQFGLFDARADDGWYPRDDIPDGLRKYHPVEIIDKCSLTVAAQYILLAGPKIYEELVEVRGGIPKKVTHDMWLHWEQRLKEIADVLGKKSDLGCMARKAYEKMRSLRYKPTRVVEPGLEIGGGRWLGLARVFGS